MKKLLAMIIGLSLTSLVWADTNADVLKKLEELQNQLEAQKAQMAEQKNEIADLHKRINETGVSREEVSAMVKQELDNTVDSAAWAQSKDVDPMVALSSHIKKLKINGDFRTRWERRELKATGSDESDRDRFRTRLRLGFTWQTNEGWEVGVGLASGSDDPRSTNDTWNESKPFETGNINLDYAYAKHTWEDEGYTATVTLGQMKNPFISSGIFWDDDVRPTGLAAHFETGGLFVTAGGFDVKYVGSNQSPAEMAAIQVGYAGEVAEGTKLTVATSYYHYNDPTSDASIAGIGLPATIDTNYQYHIGDLYGKVDTKAGGVKIGVYGHVWKNFGADSDVNNLITPTTGQTGIMTKDAQDMDLGWAAGAKLGLGPFSLGYEYVKVEADSVPSFLNCSDLGDAGVTTTDVKGHIIKAGYSVTKHFSLGFTYEDLKTIENSSDEKGKLYRLDAVYKF